MGLVTYGILHDPKNPQNLRSQLKLALGASSDHPTLRIDIQGGSFPGFFTRNVLCPGTPLSTEVLRMISENPDHEIFKDRITIRESLSSEHTKKRFETLAQDIMKTLESASFGILQEVPNPKDPYYEHFISLLSPQQKANLEKSWVCTNENNKFGLAVIINDDWEVERITESRGNDEIEKVLKAIEGTKLKEDGVNKAALYKIKHGSESYHIVNLHTDWMKPLESAKLIQASIEAGFYIGGDSNIQTMEHAKITADGRYEPGTREAELQAAHKILSDLGQKNNLHTEIVGNTVDVISPGNNQQCTFSVHHRLYGAQILTSDWLDPTPSPTGAGLFNKQQKSKLDLLIEKLEAYHEKKFKEDANSAKTKGAKFLLNTLQKINRKDDLSSLSDARSEIKKKLNNPDLEKTEFKATFGSTLKNYHIEADKLLDNEAENLLDKLKKSNSTGARHCP